MKDDGETRAVIDRLRRLSVGDPKAARVLVETLLDGDAPDLEGILKQLSHPAEGRLRHIVALAARGRPGNGRLVRHLLSWRQTETDEFTRKALEAALAGIDPSALRPQNVADLPELVATYRYVAGRLSHRVRNLLPDVNTTVRKLGDSIDGIPDESSKAECLDLLRALREAVRRVGIEVEFDQEDAYFQWKEVQLRSWVRDMNVRYSSRYSSIELQYEAQAWRPAVVHANDYLLNLVFWNLWKNAQQEVSDDCRICVREVASGPDVELCILDNGPGFNPAFAETFLQSRFSTRDTHSGVGLLEVQDAVSRLQGRAALTEIEGALRICLTLPLVLP